MTVLAGTIGVIILILLIIFVDGVQPGRLEHVSSFRRYRRQSPKKVTQEHNVAKVVGEPVYAAATEENEYNYSNRAFYEPKEYDMAHEIKRQSGVETLSQTTSSVIVFTAWYELRNMSHYKARIDHHQEYTKLYGYEYIIFVAVEISAVNRALLGDDVTVITVPEFAGRRDFQDPPKSLSPGWLKVEAFRILCKLFQKPILFFYIDMDVAFHNFGVAITDIFSNKSQSIFVQDKVSSRIFTPSHAVAIRNSPIARRFLHDWASLVVDCPAINMEQGAFMIAIARLYTNCTGINATHCQTECEPVCTQARFRYRRNNRLYSCISQFLLALESKISIYANPNLCIFPQVQSFHRAPADGFTLAIPKYNITGSCPLTYHPDKNYRKIIKPSYRDCADVSLAQNVE